MHWAERALLGKAICDRPNGPIEAPVGDNTDADDPEVFIRNMPGIDQMIPAADAQYDALVRQEDPEAREPWAFAVAAFKRCGGNVPQPVPGAERWPPPVHLYAGAPALPNGSVFEATRHQNHYTQSAGLVAVHTVVHHLMPQYPCIVNTLRARAFKEFKYDPAKYFSPQAWHDACGFVI